MEQSLRRRWRGLAAVLAGVILMVTPLLTIFRVPNFVSLFGVVWLLLVIALPGLQARQAGRSGTLGLIGTSLANIGAAVLAALFAVYGAASFFEVSPTTARFHQLWNLKDIVAFLIRFPAVLLLIGLTLFGIATFRAGVLPRWGGVMLLGLPLSISVMTDATPIAIMGPSGFFILGDLVSFAGFLAFAIGLGWLGYTLGFERRAVPRLRDLVLPLGVGLVLTLLGLLIPNRTIPALYPLSNMVAFAGFVAFAIGLIWLGYALWSGRDDLACWGALLLLTLGLVMALEIITPLHHILSPFVLRRVSGGGLVIFVTGLIWLGYALWSRRGISDQPTQRPARTPTPLIVVKPLFVDALSAARRSIRLLTTRMKRVGTGTFETNGSVTSEVPEYTSYLPESNRAGAFISYAREDKDFMRDLHEALTKHDRDTWIDWEKIPPTAKWLEEIYSGIRGSDAFVFVISPRSVDPESFCRQELAYAVEHNKRLVPIMYRSVDDGAVPPPLGDPQWIYFCESDDFDKAFQSLLRAIDTDQQWVRQHTRLLVWATDWNKRGRDNSRVLRGSDLREAEEWQVQAAEKEPKPTQLQNAYINASRKAATRRQRITHSAR